MMENPFTLTFGKPPEQFINRYDQTEQIKSYFLGKSPVSQIYLIEGVRGSGKTVLMTSIANDFSEDDEWVVLNLNPTQNLLDDFANRLSDSCKNISGLLEKGFNLSAGGFGIGINGKENEDSVSVISDLLTRLKRKKKHVLITIDEVAPDQNMRIFASQFQILIREDYPIFLLMTGLYENIYAIQNDPALTFLLRSPKVSLEPLSITQIVSHYKRVFQTDQDTAINLAKITRGYAFAFQALGLLYWEYGKTTPLEEILEKLDGMLDDFVYKKIWAGLSRQDKNVILAIGETQTAQVKDICMRTGMTSSTFAKYRERLIKQGLLTAPEHGVLSITLPRFYRIAKNYAMMEES
ncbi:MAG: ATP-binding protein [Eubacterium sp.]|nr:ATP-binding protein [Eubacterium sp.]